MTSKQGIPGLDRCVQPLFPLLHVLPNPPLSSRPPPTIITTNGWQYSLHEFTQTALLGYRDGADFLIWWWSSLMLDRDWVKDSGLPLASCTVMYVGSWQRLFQLHHSPTSGLETPRETEGRGRRRHLINTGFPYLTRWFMAAARCLQYYFPTKAKTNAPVPTSNEHVYLSQMCWFIKCYSWTILEIKF